MKLVILNGPSGVGKSTISARLQEELPGSVHLDVDELRRALPNYREQKEESLRIAYEKTAEAIGHNLEAGRTVIVDKAISRPETIETFIQMGKKHGAEVYEFLLMADKETVQKRADARGYRPGSLLTPDKVGELWEKAEALRKERPDAIVIDTTGMSAEELFQKVRAGILEAITS